MKYIVKEKKDEGDQDQFSFIQNSILLPKNNKFIDS